jgi:hypothetical protein
MNRTDRQIEPIADRAADPAGEQPTPTPPRYFVVSDAPFSISTRADTIDRTIAGLIESGAWENLNATQERMLRGLFERADGDFIVHGSARDLARSWKPRPIPYSTWSDNWPAIRDARLAQSVKLPGGRWGIRLIVAPESGPRPGKRADTLARNPGHGPKSGPAPYGDINARPRPAEKKREIEILSQGAEAKADALSGPDLLAGHDFPTKAGGKRRCRLTQHEIGKAVELWPRLHGRPFGTADAEKLIALAEAPHILNPFRFAQAILCNGFIDERPAQGQLFPANHPRGMGGAEHDAAKREARRQEGQRTAADRDSWNRPCDLSDAQRTAKAARERFAEFQAGGRMAEVKAAIDAAAAHDPATARRWSGYLTEGRIEPDLAAILATVRAPGSAAGKRPDDRA